jgi:hypothetical protein
MRKRYVSLWAIAIFFACIWTACDRSETTTQVRIADLGPALSADRIWLDSIHARLKADTVHDSAYVSTWGRTFDSLRTELDDIAHDYAAEGPQLQIANNREKDRMQILEARLDGLEQAMASAPLKSATVISTYTGPILTLDGKSKGFLLPRKWGGTSTTTQWPPEGQFPPIGLAVKVDSQIVLFLKNGSIRNWKISLYRESAIPVLDTTAWVEWLFPGLDTVRISPERFDSIAALLPSRKMRFNMRIICNGPIWERNMLVTGLEYDGETRRFAPKDTVYDEYALNYSSSWSKLACERDSGGSPISTYIFIPGSPYFAPIDTLDFQKFPSPFQPLEMRLLALPADMRSGQEVKGLVYSLATEDSSGEIRKTFFPISLVDTIVFTAK